MNLRWLRAACCGLGELSTRSFTGVSRRTSLSKVLSPENRSHWCAARQSVNEKIKAQEIQPDKNRSSLELFQWRRRGITKFNSEPPQARFLPRL